MLGWNFALPKFGYKFACKIRQLCLNHQSILEVFNYNILGNMDKAEIANYYSSLPHGEKGRFTAFLSIHLGGAPHTWQQKILGCSLGVIGKPLSPIVSKEINSIIQKGTWRG